MLVPVVEHDVANELGAGHSKHFLVALDHAPGFSHLRVVKFRQQIPDGRYAFFKLVQNFLPASRLRKAGKVGCGGRAVLYELDYASGHKSEMESKLSSRHGFFVRLPGQAVFRQTLQKFARNRSLLFEFLQNTLCSLHGVSPFPGPSKTFSLIQPTAFTEPSRISSAFLPRRLSREHECSPSLVRRLCDGLLR